MRLLRRSIAYLLLIWHLPACSAANPPPFLGAEPKPAFEWRALDEVDLPAYLAQENPYWMGVQLVSSPEIRLMGPVAKDGMLIGFIGQEPFSVPLSEVRAVQVKTEATKTNTVVTIAAIAGAALLVAVLVAGAQTGRALGDIEW